MEKQRIEIAIIGPARDWVEGKRYQNMVAAVETMIESAGYSWSQVELVSGGSSFSDHVAVTLYLKYREKGATLHLHLPADFKDGRFASTRAGCLLNHIHLVFSEKCLSKKSSLDEIALARKLGAKLSVYGGMMQRNRAVAMTPILIAFSATWDAKTGVTGPPKSGGTYRTWSMAKGFRCYIPLAGL